MRSSRTFLQFVAACFVITAVRLAHTAGAWALLRFRYLTSRAFAMLRACALALVIGTLSAPDALALPITVMTSYYQARVSDPDFGAPIFDQRVIDAIPVSTTLSKTQGNSSNRTIIDWSGDDDSVLIAAAFNHSINNSNPFKNDYALTWVLPTAFRANVDAHYKISGFYAVTATPALYPGSSGFSATFEDMTTHEMLPIDHQTYGIGDQFRFFSVAGDGILLAGHVYSLSSTSIIFSQGAIVASALGSLTLQIQVPEPSTVALLGLAFVSLVLSRRRKSH